MFAWFVVIERAGEIMFKSVRIQNFRQFKDLKLDGLAQKNLITGKNDTGKTSLLEALWLYMAGGAC